MMMMTAMKMMTMMMMMIMTDGDIGNGVDNNEDVWGCQYGCSYDNAENCMELREQQ